MVPVVVGVAAVLASHSDKEGLDEAHLQLEMVHNLHEAHKANTGERQSRAFARRQQPSPRSYPCVSQNEQSQLEKLIVRVQQRIELQGAHHGQLRKQNKQDEMEEPTVQDRRIIAPAWQGWPRCSC